MSLVDARTKLYGLVGYRIGYTLSPAIHNHVFRITGFNGVYLAFDTPPERFERVFSSLLEIAEGLNVTIPFKETAAGYLRELHETASKTGAVNTVWRGVGYNTDYLAIKQLVYEKLGELWNASCLVAGAGGAGRAAAFALGELGCTVWVLNRTRWKAEELASRLARHGLDARVEDSCSRMHDVVVNATPAPEWVLEQGCRARRLVVELVYRPVATSLVVEASRRGVGVVDGLEVLVRQALLAQSIWQERDLSGLESEVRRHICLETLSGEC